jgi:hypothetical protein
MPSPKDHATPYGKHDGDGVDSAFFFERPSAIEKPLRSLTVAVQYRTWFFIGFGGLHGSGTPSRLGLGIVIHQGL